MTKVEVLHENARISRRVWRKLIGLRSILADYTINMSPYLTALYIINFFTLNQDNKKYVHCRILIMIVFITVSGPRCEKNLSLIDLILYVPSTIFQLCREGNLTLLHANNIGADQPAHLRSLISIFVKFFLKYYIVKSDCNVMVG